MTGVKGITQGAQGEIEQEFRVRTSPGRAIYSGRGANWEREHVRQPLRACVCGVYVRARLVAALEIPGSILATCRYYLMNGYPCITGCV